jgi:hypothetical protein
MRALSPRCLSAVHDRRPQTEPNTLHNPRDLETRVQHAESALDHGWLRGVELCVGQKKNRSSELCT